MANNTEAKKTNKPIRPFMMIVSVWNPHDMPIAYPGLMANYTNTLEWNMSNFMVEQVGGGGVGGWWWWSRWGVEQVGGGLNHATAHYQARQS